MKTKTIIVDDHSLFNSPVVGFLTNRMRTHRGRSTVERPIASLPTACSRLTLGGQVETPMTG